MLCVFICILDATVNWGAWLLLMTKYHIQEMKFLSGGSKMGKSLAENHITRLNFPPHLEVTGN